jgi:hypothetical protein
MQDEISERSRSQVSESEFRALKSEAAHMRDHKRDSSPEIDGARTSGSMSGTELTQKLMNIIKKPKKT